MVVEVFSVCPETSCLDEKIQFRGVLKKMTLRVTGVNERLFYLTQRRKWRFRPNTVYWRIDWFKVLKLVASFRGE